MEKICNVSDIPEGIMKGFTIKGRQILLANVDGKFYAMDAVCSHKSGYLPAGRLEKNIVICPVHEAEFDVTTGKVIKNISSGVKMITGREAKDLNVFKVLLEGEDIYIEV